MDEKQRKGWEKVEEYSACLDEDITVLVLLIAETGTTLTLLSFCREFSCHILTDSFSLNGFWGKCFTTTFMATLSKPNTMFRDFAGAAFL